VAIRGNVFGMANEQQGAVENQSVPRLTIILVPFGLNGLRLEAAHRAGTRFGTTLITGHPEPGESLDAAASRLVEEWFGARAQYVEQLYTLSVDRNGQQEVTIGYIVLFRQDIDMGRADERVVWSPVDQLLIHDETHRMVFDYALIRLRAKLGYTNIAFHLLPVHFTLSDLQQTYEMVLGHPVDKRNFRRRMVASGTLTKTQELRRDGSHRPAALYRYVAQDDHAEYLTPSWAAATQSHRQTRNSDE
jgi:8-oxo-dGTP diphosphatase